MTVHAQQKATATSEPPPPYQQTTGVSYVPPPPGASVQYTVPTGSTTPHQTVVISQPRPYVYGQSNLYTPSPMTLVCPHCSTEVTTKTKKKCGIVVWSIVGYLCLIGFALPCIWLGFCFIPFCIKSLYDIEHSCPNCHKIIGRHPAGGIR